MGIKYSHSSLRTKIEIRQWVIDKLGGDLTKLGVLELYGGEGDIYDAVWNNGCARHLAFDTKKIDRPTWLRGDSRVLLPAYVNDGFDIFDADAYGNPWIVLSDVARLVNPGTYAFVATCGMEKVLRAKPNQFLRQRSGTDQFTEVHMLHKWYDDVVRWIVEDWQRFGVRPVVAARAYNEHRYRLKMVYWAMVVEKGKGHGEA